jgi:SAM-dependent methyltransferase
VSVLRAVNEVRFWRYRRRFGGLSRRETFTTIYEERLFGDLPGEGFYSGNGSTGYFADVYCTLVQDLVREKGIRSLVDLGCGDFRIGARLAPMVEKYTGIDIVPDLIGHHQANYASEVASFVCLDIVDDPLPVGDLCLLRQVLQHLNNAEIATVLKKLTAYKWVLITENVSAGEIRFPNVNHVHGPETRLVEGSGVFVTEPPFSMPAVRTWGMPYDATSVLLTTLIANDVQCSPRRETLD